MKYLILILLGLCGSVSAQTARELFNPAAKEYIYGNNPAASNLVTKALQKYPDDKKLQKLKELIEQQQEQQQNQEQNQNQDPQQQNQDQSEQDQSEQDPQEQQEQDPQQQEQPEQEEQEAEPTPAQPHQAGEMSEEEAKQLLDSMKQNEKDQRQDLRPYLGQPVKVDKDW